MCLPKVIVSMMGYWLLNIYTKFETQFLLHLKSLQLTLGILWVTAGVMKSTVVLNPQRNTKNPAFLHFTWVLGKLIHILEHTLANQNSPHQSRSSSNLGTHTICTLTSIYVGMWPVTSLCSRLQWELVWTTRGFIRKYNSFKHWRVKSRHRWDWSWR